ncbi:MULTISPECIES: LysR family transcriptional regulator [unclassified Mesorhizobium]|uniref:LysR family transcriptional regulator n=1 Tax=unclassified Mesorhizobium TaxID=325217 RepID=UPI001676510D|nr:MULTISPECIES: LysR family transcriptional regulator [unclassified Mesorhizobium]
MIALNSSPHGGDATRRSVQLASLRFAVAVGEERSLLGASRRLGIHHSALSRRVKDLELALGMALFERHPGGVRATVAGKRFLASMRRVLKDLDDTLSTGLGKSDQLSIGLDAPLSNCAFLDAVVAFMGDNPDTAVILTEAPTAELASGLRDRSLETVIAPSRGEHPDYASLPLWWDRIMVAMAPDNPLADFDVVECDGIGQQTILANTHCSDLSLVPGTILRELPRPIIRHDVSRISLINLVRRGLGITLLRESDARSMPHDIVFRPLHWRERPMRIRHCATWRRDNSNPVLAAFIAFLLKRCPAP